jgi:GntR family transcriptional regulator
LLFTRRRGQAFLRCRPRQPRDGTRALTRQRGLCHILCVTPFGFELRPGLPIFDQVVYAAMKAFVSGQFQEGDAFPSVRTLAAELKIHPNTAHKVVQHLIQEGFLESRPGVGTVVARLPAARAAERRRLLEHEVEHLVVEAKRVGLDLPDVLDAVETQWARLDRSQEVSRK